MKLTRLTPLEAEQRRLITSGAPASSPGELLVDALREEAFAATLVTRPSLLERVRRRHSLDDVTRLTEWLDQLLTWGDLLAGPRGKIAPAPARIVELSDGALVLLGGIPTASLPGQPGLSDGSAGLPRRLAAVDGAGRERWRQWLDDQGGLWLSVVRWSGLDRVPRWQAWLDELEARRGLDGSSLAGPVAEAAHEVFLADARRPRWPRRWRAATLTESTALVRSRREHGWSYGLAWHDGERVRGLALSSDEARRTCCALAAAAGCPVPFQQQLQGTEVLLSFEPWLPGAERRALRVSAERAEHDEPGRYRLPLARWQALRPWIETHTGMAKERDNG